MAEKASNGQRFPHHVYRTGTEPDPRMSLANQRTYLAWIRTALGLLATGVGLQAVDLPVPNDIVLASSALLMLLGILAGSQAWLDWAATERALRESRPVPPPRMGLLLSVGTVVTGLLLAVGLLLP